MLQHYRNLLGFLCRQVNRLYLLDREDQIHLELQVYQPLHEVLVILDFLSVQGHPYHLCCLDFRENQVDQLYLLDPDIPRIEGARRRKEQVLTTTAWMGSSVQSLEMGELGPEVQAGGDQDSEVSSCKKVKFMKDYLGQKAACGCYVHELPSDLLATLPFELIPENQQKIQNWLLQHFGSSAFNV